MAPEVASQAVALCDTAAAAERQLGRWLDELGARRVFLVSGGDSFRRCGAEALVAAALGTRTLCRFPCAGADPAASVLAEGVGRFKALGPDSVLAVGGGSVMDLAKLIALFASADIDPLRWAGEPLDGIEAALPPGIMIPTTAGSGSEATSFAVLYRAKRKYSVEHPALRPGRVLLYPGLTASLSGYQRACSGFDALAQAIESATARGATADSRAFSRQALALCRAHLERMVADPEWRDREAMLRAAYHAGQAINRTRTTAAHALSYPLTAHYGVPHGHAVALFLPAVVRFNAMHGVRAVEGFDAASVRRLADRIGLTRAWLAEGGHDRRAVAERVVAGVNAERLRNNPCPLAPDDLMDVALRALIDEETGAGKC